MKNHENIFGTGVIYNESDLNGKIYATSAACMSVWSDFLSWANANEDRMVLDPSLADSIVVLGCQVTDLSILNDLEVAHKLHQLYNKDIYMGGCLAQRFDISLPSYIKRLDVVRTINQSLDNKKLVNYEKPFWVPDFEETQDELKDGNLFRNFYPLKIGAGCHGKCKYCTIRHTRGDNYATVPNEQIKEFLDHDNVVIISDSPTAYQIKEWSNIAIKYNKPFSIRNVEPQTLIMCEKELMELASLKLLKILHCPVQSFNDEILKIMNRSVEATKAAVVLIKNLREKGVVTATNIIIDYVYEGKLYPNYDIQKLNETFDYYSWNPYFDGNFDIEKARARFKKYITKESR